MKKDKKCLYEGMYIISATLSEEARKKALDKIVQGIEEKAGEIHKIHEMGRKRLAYEIDGKREGYYFVVFFSIIPGAIDELWKEYHLHEDLIRFSTLRTDAVQESLEFQLLKQA